MAYYPNKIFKAKDNRTFSRRGTNSKFDTLQQYKINPTKCFDVISTFSTM